MIFINPLLCVNGLSLHVFYYQLSLSAREHSMCYQVYHLVTIHRNIIYYYLGFIYFYRKPLKLKKKKNLSAKNIHCLLCSYIIFKK